MRSDDVQTPEGIVLDAILEDVRYSKKAGGYQLVFDIPENAKEEVAELLKHINEKLRVCLFLHVDE